MTLHRDDDAATGTNAVAPGGVASSGQMAATDASTQRSTAVAGGVLPDLEDAEVVIVDDTPPRSQLQLIARRFFRHKLAVVALVVLVLLYLAAIFADQLAPYEIDQSLDAATLGESLQPPSGKHWFGTDQLGRDMLTRVLFAARVSLKIGLAVAVLSTIIGTLIGAFAGYVGGLVDKALMFVTDLALVVPGLAVLLIAQKKVGGSTTMIIVILSLLFWTTIARVIRGVFLSLKEKEFVESARALGASRLRIIFRHMLPNAVGPIIVNLTLVVGVAILTESTLSFLGFGVADVSWGKLVAEAKGWVGGEFAYLIYFPGLALLITVLCVNYLGDGLRDALDPQAKN